eukprot:3361822-Prorocentrum_lima.AAC.1
MDWQCLKAGIVDDQAWVKPEYPVKQGATSLGLIRGYFNFPRTDEAHLLGRMGLDPWTMKRSRSRG